MALPPSAAVGAVQVCQVSFCRGEASGLAALVVSWPVQAEVVAATRVSRTAESRWSALGRLDTGPSGGLVGFHPPARGEGVRGGWPGRGMFEVRLPLKGHRYRGSLAKEGRT
ncbi:hypothetical protein GCM10020000_27680 [Streptomyces olivoverticillatus]